ncbi:MAG: NTP transferase domain-containing protein [Candidatus Eisenbacteria bacterium]|uniref:NTP transferase domain-containing protein n=1 Tax=Eiseniibacteriota bacterium TaxID=2212470 RepID=A0A956NCX2_UNCEI|nr:NTP transferase domain-containing protein [Candidatus Eisenbacteria bacterium]MCB9462494.1 NTP transferase domain-containing protein [Candidatus Eisenbacteria bacterium]
MTHKLSAVLISGRPQTAKSRPGLLDFGGAKVAERTVSAYSDFAQVVLVVAGDADGFPKGPNVTVVTVSEDAVVSKQIKAGLDAMDKGNDGFCTGLIDQPLLTAELVNGMAEAFLGGSDKILVPLALRQIGQPAFFRKDLASDFAKLADAETAWSILKSHGNDVAIFDTNETSVLRNIEDMDDYHAMLQIAGHPVPVAAEED